MRKTVFDQYSKPKYAEEYSPDIPTKSMSNGPVVRSGQTTSYKVNLPTATVTRGTFGSNEDLTDMTIP